MRIIHGVWYYDDYFQLNIDYTRLTGFSSIQKCTTAMLCRVYEFVADTVHDYPRMPEFTSTKDT